MTRESWSQEIPEKEQCAAGDKEGFQSSMPEPLGPIIEDLSFKSTSRSPQREVEKHTEKRKIIKVKWRRLQVKKLLIL